MSGKRTLVHGVGINDADYPVKPRVNGKQVVCVFYEKWASLLQRCYSEKYHKRRPTYAGCSVVPEWHSFMNFRSWMVQQDWEGNQLDKDLLIEGNKVYGPDTCVFVSRQVNMFILGNETTRGIYPIGVSFHKKSSKFAAQYSAFGKVTHIGYFSSVVCAHSAYMAHKGNLATKLAAEQTDSRVSSAILSRFKI